MMTEDQEEDAIEVTHKMEINEDPEEILKKIRQDVMLAFEVRLNKILKTWDGHSLVDITVKFSIVPSVHFDLGEVRKAIPTKILRRILDLLATAPMMGMTEIIKWVLVQTKEEEENETT